jgi:hypothetical protein
MVQDSEGELEPPTGYSSARAKDLIVNGTSASTRWQSHGESRSLQTILPKVQEAGAKHTPGWVRFGQVGSRQVKTNRTRPSIPPSTLGGAVAVLPVVVVLPHGTCCRAGAALVSQQGLGRTYYASSKR